MAAVVVSGVIGMFLLVWLIFAGIGVVAGAIAFGTTFDNQGRDDAAHLMRVSLVWPLWVGLQIGRALRWSA